jgi:hypothetical protein
MQSTANHSTLGKWLFWFSLIASEIVGVTIGRLQAKQFFSSQWFVQNQTFWETLAFQIATAALCFLVLYGLASNILSAAGNKLGLKISRPGLAQGLLYAAAIPLVLCAIGFAIILFLSGSSIYG